jgi:hypothetical protein
MTLDEPGIRDFAGSESDDAEERVVAGLAVAYRGDEVGGVAVGPRAVEDQKVEGGFLKKLPALSQRPRPPDAARPSSLRDDCASAVTARDDPATSAATLSNLGVDIGDPAILSGRILAEPGSRILPQPTRRYGRQKSNTT